MAGFTVEDQRLATGTSTDPTKITDNSTQTSPEEVGGPITITVDDPSDFVHIMEVRAKMAANAAIGVSATLRISHRIRDASGGEPSWTEYGSDTIGTGNNNCTNNVFSDESDAGTPLHAGGLGEDVEIDYGLNVDGSLNATHYCTRDREADWERFRRVDRQFGGQFRGSFA